MKVLVIYDSECRPAVEALRKSIAEEFGASTVLRIKSKYTVENKTKHFRKRKFCHKKQLRLPKHAWHFDAVKMMKLADTIVYFASENSAKNENVEWELKKALKLGKSIICLNTSGYNLNACLYGWDNLTKSSICLADKTLKNADNLLQFLRDHNNGNDLRLFNSDNPNALMEQYKQLIDSTEKLLERRQNTNNFYVGVSSAIVTVCAGILTSDKLGSGIKFPVVFALALFGIFISRSWNRSLVANRINNKAKMKLLSMIEKRLPASTYDAEWRAMKNKYSNEKYISFTDNEQKLTNIFFVMYIVVSLVSVALSVLHYCGVNITL